MFYSLQEMVEKSQLTKQELWEVILEDDIKERGVTKEASFSKMEYMYDAMRTADKNYNGTIKSNSGLVGGDGALFEAYLKQEKTLCGNFIGTVIIKAIKMAESNACMKKIVAAPTAGSCGVIPAVFLSYEEKQKMPKEDMIKAMFLAAGVGQVIATKASISGAEGGCQAEIGSASAMAAAGVVYLKGGTSDMIINSVAFAIKNLLGLVCDPVAGLVEVPCVKRNVMGAVNALTSADLALAGIQSKITPDEVIDTMENVGKQIPSCLRETGEGGLAVTPTGISIKRNVLE